MLDYVFSNLIGAYNRSRAGRTGFKSKPVPGILKGQMVPVGGSQHGSARSTSPTGSRQASGETTLNIEAIILQFIMGLLPKSFAFGPFDVTIPGSADKVVISGTINIAKG